MTDLSEHEKKKIKAFIETHGSGQFPMVLPKPLAEIARAIGASASTWVEQKPILLGAKTLTADVVDDLAIYGTTIKDGRTGGRIDPRSVYKKLEDMDD